MSTIGDRYDYPARVGVFSNDLSGVLCFMNEGRSNDPPSGIISNSGSDD